jgi:hypothetical protein
VISAMSFRIVPKLGSQIDPATTSAPAAASLCAASRLRGPADCAPVVVLHPPEGQQRFGGTVAVQLWSVQLLSSAGRMNPAPTGRPRLVKNCTKSSVASCFPPTAPLRV